jgi:hypothetical protein
MTTVDWLVDSDPAIRWQVFQDLVHAPDDMVMKERARVAVEGWGARLLALQGEDGQWAGGACFPARSLHPYDKNNGQPWIATLPTLQLLHDFGVDPDSERVRRAVALVRNQRSLCSARNSSPMEPGCLRTRIPARCTFRWRMAAAGPAVGTR